MPTPKFFKAVLAPICVKCCAGLKMQMTQTQWFQARGWTARDRAKLVVSVARV